MSIARYQALMVQLFRARAAPESVDEEKILERMDVAWERMTKAEQGSINSLSARIASGTLSETRFVELATLQPPPSLLELNEVTESAVPPEVMLTLAGAYKASALVSAPVSCSTRASSPSVSLEAFIP